MTVDIHMQNLITAPDTEKIETLKHVLNSPEYKTSDLTFLNLLIESLYNLAKFTNQVNYINILLQKLTQNEQDQIFKIVTEEWWDKIENNRKDKFFYLIEKINKTPLMDLLHSNLNDELKIFFIRKLLDTEISKDTTSNYINNILDYFIMCKKVGVCRVIATYLYKYSNKLIENKKIIMKEYKKKSISAQKREMFIKMLISIKENAVIKHEEL
ncbi:hypothetical protein EDEG_03562 [Edhazardia aedis USNM 41457]|uniref:Uncharacterized protein n=1 Tax=Edhazardia aedis (strain USNM 41457) TaxID=1003232 RepID=J9DKR4_EDHAE|nr:hypothetical protein EDEG_03562 [Edhazardia aedis USNM 41457]|eukprot:EJW01982.1 hypothetical protein EDEG_03562 [Edhazardia aedis USNM 41457]